MKLNQLVVEVVDSNVSAIALANAVNTFLTSVGEATLIAIEYQVTSEPRWSAMIIYAK